MRELIERKRKLVSDAKKAGYIGVGLISTVIDSITDYEIENFKKDFPATLVFLKTDDRIKSYILSLVDINSVK